jgi:hypothetical protein
MANKEDKKEKMSTAEKVLSYPARVAILGGTALGKAADQALYNSGIVDKENPRYKKSIREGRGYEEAKKLGRVAVGLDDLEGMKKGGKVKKYADGGMTQQPTYPFYGNQPQAGGQNGGTNQTFNMQPQANAGAPNQQQPMQQPMQAFKKGGKVSSASSRADGCAIRGKTRA